MKRCSKVGFAVVGLGAIAQGSVLPSFRHTKQAKLVALVSCEKPLDLRKMYSCPESERAAYQEAVWFPHQNFLGSSEDTDTIADAIEKVLAIIEELRGLDHKAIQNQRLGRADRES